MREAVKDYFQARPHLSRTGYRILTKPARNSPPPLWGRTDSAEGRARRGVAGIGLPVEAGPSYISRRGKAHVIRQARPLRLTDLSPSTVRCSMPGDPLLARPSAESVLPTRGRRSDSAS